DDDAGAPDDDAGTVNDDRRRSDDDSGSDDANAPVIVPIAVATAVCVTVTMAVSMNFDARTPTVVADDEDPDLRRLRPNHEDCPRMVPDDARMADAATMNDDRNP